MIVGYKLIDADKGTVIQQWGGVWGQTPGIPNPITLPNGDQVHGASVNDQYEGLVLVPWEMDPPPLVGTDINAERERRIAAGVTVTLSSAKTIAVQTRDDTDIRNLETLSGEAVKAIIAGLSITIPFRDASDQTWLLTPEEMAEMTSLVAQNGSAIYEKSWALKAMSPIPIDYADDKYWK